MRIYIIISVLFTLFIGAVLVIDASYTDFLFKEDGIIEFASVGLALISMALAFILTYIGYRKKEVWRFWLGLGVLSFLYIGESLSWGERIFDLKMPKVAGVTFDAFHDLLAISVSLVKKTRDIIIDFGISDPKSIAIMVSAVAIIGAFLYFTAKIIIKHKKEIAQFFKVNLQKPPFLFFFIAIIMILIALIVDEDNLIGFPHKEVVDEGLEVLAILAFIFSSVCGFIGGKMGFGQKKILIEKS